MFQLNGRRILFKQGLNWRKKFFIPFLGIRIQISHSKEHSPKRALIFFFYFLNICRNCRENSIVESPVMGTDIAQVCCAPLPAFQILQNGLIILASKVLLIRKNKVRIKIGQHPKWEQFYSHPNREDSIITVLMVLHKRNIWTMLNFPIERVQKFLMLMRLWINRRIQIANGAVLMRMEISKPRSHRNFYFFKSRKERPSQQAVKLIYLYNPWKACSGIVGPICFSKR